MPSTVNTLDKIMENKRFNLLPDSIYMLGALLFLNLALQSGTSGNDFWIIYFGIAVFFIGYYLYTQSQQPEDEEPQKPAIKEAAQAGLSTPIESFETDLGTVTLSLETSDKIAEFNVENKSDKNIIFIKASSYTITIISFKEITKWLKGCIFEVSDSQGWIILIQKTSRGKAPLSFTCYLHKASESVTSDVNCGESLDALWIEDEKNVMSIGTEDGEYMKTRAIRNDWMPSRLKSQLGYHSKNRSFTEILDYGFYSKIPHLKEDEKMYLQYLVATDTRRKSKDYPDEDDISTWFAVDYPKYTLIEKLDISEYFE